MNHLIERAVQGRKAALLALADRSIARVYPLVYTMLDTDADVVAVCESTYRTLWAALTPDFTEERAVSLAVTTAAEACRRLLQKKDAKAFRIPSDRRFLLREPVAFTPAPDQPLAVEVIHALPPQSRLLLAGMLAGGLCADELASILKLDARTLNTAIDDQKLNINALLAQANDPSLATYDDLVAAWETLSVPPSAEALDAINATVCAVSAPKEKARRRKTWSIIGIVVGICVTVTALCAVVLWDMTRPTDTDFTSDDNSQTQQTDPNNSPADVAFSTEYTATHVAQIAIQDHGTVTVELDAGMAPQTVANFEKLANSGFYDGLTFHRIMEGFMMQGGDPNGNGSGGSDVNVVGEFSANGYENTLTHTRGAISMARATDYDSGSSQFFIVHEDSTFLDGDYAAFGYVTDGMDIVDAICTSAEPTDNNGSISYADQPIITSVTVTAL